MDRLFHPSRPYKEAKKPLTEGYQQSQAFMAPFGQRAQEVYSEMLHPAMNLDPKDLQNNWINSYMQSPQAQQNQEIATQRGLDAASSMGLSRSSPVLSAIQAGTTNIVNEDRQNYLNDLMQKYLTNIGIGQNIYGAGAGVAPAMGNAAMNYGAGMAGLKYNQGAAGPDMLTNLLSRLGGAAGGWATSMFGGQ